MLEGRKAAAVVFYTVNGRGVGHLNRARSVAVELQRVCTESGRSIQIYILTSSDAVAFLSSCPFPVFKVPSEHFFEKDREAQREYVRAARQIICSILSVLAPEMLIVDGSPSGSFAEFSEEVGKNILAASVRTTAYIFRPMREDVMRAGAIESKIAPYDLVIVPELECYSNITANEGLAQKIRYVGPIVSPEVFSLPSREKLRREFGIPAGAYAIYVSTGGGGTADARNRLLRIWRVVREIEDVHVFMGIGPLGRSLEIDSERIHLVRESPAVRSMAACDVAVSAAGANSFAELMYLGIPTIFLPLITKADDQYGRARRAEKVGGAVCLDLGEDFEFALHEVLKKWRDPGARKIASDCARLLIPDSGAVRCAQLLKDLLARAED